MNPLETLKLKLQNKPEVKPNEGVKVVLAPKIAEKIKPIIREDKDAGEKAKEILEKMKKKKLSAVIKKIAEEPQTPIQAPKAPVVEKEKTKLPKKIKKTKIIIADENPDEIAEEIMPEGGPRLEEEPKEAVEPLVIEEEEAPQPVPVPQPATRPVPKKRTTPKVKQGVITLGPEEMIEIDGKALVDRLPPVPEYTVKVSSYFMNNREIFVNFINGLFEEYKADLDDETKGISCEDIGKDTGEVSLLTHQKIVRDYMNLYTPYRGLLLYHGLGSGKTCSSIAIAEGMKSARKVIIMTPASLRRNYMEEIKKCGDLLYRKNQFWEWISTDNNVNLLKSLSSALGLSRDFITRHGGAWLTNVSKPTNYNELSSSDKRMLNDQLDEMISNKYKFINYNGLRRDKFKQLTNNFEDNIFDNAVVIIDEAHNLISRIVNKINKTSKFSQQKRGPGARVPLSLALILYEYLLKADNCRVVLLTGTPMINYPNEIGILFNILRGYIKTWTFTLTTDINKLSNETLKEIFFKEKVLDYYNYVPSSKTLTVTRNPYGFENKTTASSGYKGVTNEKKEKRNASGEVEKDSKGKIIYEERGQMSDTDFVQRIVKLLKKNDITAVQNGTTYSVHTALPDTLDEFVEMFIDRTTGNVFNMDKFKRRIIGLTSYFRSAQEELLPAYDRNFNRHVVYVPMSDYQFKVYENYRKEERKREQKQKKGGPQAVDPDGLFKEPSSTYKIFSRLACNFTMPVPPGRPIPSEYGLTRKTKADQLYSWMKENYFNDTDQYDEDMRQRFDELKSQFSDEKWNSNIVQDDLKMYIDMYLTKYFSENYRGPMKDFIISHGGEWLFDANANAPPQQIIQATNKAEEKGKKKSEEKEEKERKKAEEKADKERKKAEEKADKERKKAEEKAEKERKKAEEKEEKARKKAEEKAMKKQKGGDEDFDGNLDEDFDGNMMEGGVKEDENIDPARRFIDEHDDETVSLNQEEYKDEDAILREADELEGDEILEQMGSVEYKEAITSALRYLKLHSREYLSPEGLATYSPKFLAMLENITDPEHRGLHLIYSQFRSMEGIGIFSMVLEANGFAKFKIKRTGMDGWEINMSEEDMGKPCYALYTGTEDAEEREIIRNIYNGTWNYIPNNIAQQLKAKSQNNNFGEIIKVLMITSAGSEGINLRNTRYVHITEPYWHPVRVEQVIGRARRICSHQSLPKQLQTVEVFIYIAKLTKAQLDSDFSIELKLKDTSKNPPFLPQTSDEKLFEISTIKEQLSSQMLKAIKESSIDCATHSSSNKKEGLTCLTFGQPSVNDFAYNPDIAQDENDTVADINKVTIDWEARVFTHKPTGKQYVLRMDTRQVYDYESVMQAKRVPGFRPILIGKLVKNRNGEVEIVKENM